MCVTMKSQLYNIFTWENILSALRSSSLKARSKIPSQFVSNIGRMYCERKFVWWLDGGNLCEMGRY